MSTGQSIINRALRLIGATASGEVATSQESADALEAMTQLIGSWKTEKLLVYARQTLALSLVPAQQVYTIGPTGNLVANRPIRIEEAYLRVNSQDYPLTIVTEALWAALPDKLSQAEYPEWLLYRGAMPNGELTLYPIPSAVHTLYLVTWTALETIGLADTVSLPPGYERALVYNLAIDLAPEYEKEVPQAVAMIASDSLASIKRANQRPIEAMQELGSLFQGSTQ